MNTFADYTVKMVPKSLIQMLLVSPHFLTGSDLRRDVESRIKSITNASICAECYQTRTCVRGSARANVSSTVVERECQVVNIELHILHRI